MNGTRRIARVWVLVPLVLAVVLFLAILPGQGGFPSAQAAVHAYVIDTQASRLTVRLFRKGVLSFLAHDHVLVGAGITGEVFVDLDDLSQSSLRLSIPVASLQVDPQEEREQLELAGQIEDDDRAAIRENMLSPEQLGAARFPRVESTLVSLSGSLPDVTLAVRMRIKKVWRVLHIPAKVTLNGTALRATGEFTLRQSDFGIKAFNDLLGAIAVQDEVHIRFVFFARSAK